MKKLYLFLIGISILFSILLLAETISSRVIPDSSTTSRRTTSTTTSIRTTSTTTTIASNPSCQPVTLTVNPNPATVGSNIVFEARSSYPYVYVSLWDPDDGERMNGVQYNGDFYCCDPLYTWRWTGIAISPGNYRVYFNASTTDPPSSSSWCTFQPINYEIRGQSTTTTVSTTTAVTSTVTTTTITPVILQCEKNQINVGETNNCTVSNCNTGMWVVANKEGQPLDPQKIIIEDIPPNKVTFGPTSAEGKIITLAFCLSPSASLRHETIVGGGRVTSIFTTTSTIIPYNFKIELKGDYDQSYENSTIYIENDKIGEACSRGCLLCNQTTGLITNINNIENYCYDNKLQVIFLDSTSVNSDCNSVHKACIYVNNEWKCCEKECDNYGCENSIIFDCTTWRCVETYEFKSSAVECNQDKCTLEIEKNTLGLPLNIYTYLIKEPEGKIYYSGFTNINSGFEGQKDISLNAITVCPSGTKLTIIINVYDKDLNRIYNAKIKDGFEC